MQAWAPEYGSGELEGISATSQTALSNMAAPRYVRQFKLMEMKEN